MCLCYPRISNPALSRAPMSLLSTFASGMSVKVTNCLYTHTIHSLKMLFYFNIFFISPVFILFLIVINNLKVFLPFQIIGTVQSR